ncbi:MAG: SpoIIE family protein phosphatase [Actinomycetota bacterium]|nr:SpoIIE family protein phosphatase [Actinomycetota bacterium]
MASSEATLRAPVPDDEPQRLEAIRRYDILDTPPDGAFDRITAVAAAHFEVPIAIVSIVDEDRIWFKSHHGVDVEEIGRDPGLCASAILQSEPWIVENAATDPRTLANPLVAGELGLRFYAGAPLVTQDGFKLGTLCVIDVAPRELPSEQAATLADMAAIVMDELELRLAARRAIAEEHRLRHRAEALARSLQTSLLPPKVPTVAGLELASLYVPAVGHEVGGDFYDAFEVGAPGEGTLVLAVGDVSGKGPEAAAVTALGRHTVRSASLSATAPSEVLETVNRAMLLGRTEPGLEHFCTLLLAFARRDAGGFSLTVASAGHPPALVLRADGSATQIGASGPPAGWRPDFSLRDDRIRLSPGDLLLLYTDGLTDVRTPDGLLGSDGLLGRLQDARPRTAAGLVAQLRELLGSPELTARDDAAALALEVVG